MKKIFYIHALMALALLISCHQKPAGDESLAKTEAQPVAVKEYPKIIAAKIFIKPEKIREFLGLFKGMTENTLKEPGCTGYQLYQNPYTPTQFLVFETYKNQAAIDAHFAAPYFKEFGDKISMLVSQPTEIRIIDVAAETVR